MTDDEVQALEYLTQAYVDAHVARIAPPEEGVRRRLCESSPLRDEYAAVRGAVRDAAPSPRHSDAYVEGYVDDLLQGGSTIRPRYTRA